jgi:Predicted permeases
MDITTKLLFIGTDLILPLALGYYCRRRKWLGDVLCNRIIEINITVFSTLLSILSFWILPLSPALLWLPGFGILLSLIPGLTGYLVARRKYADGPEKASYVAAAILSNIGTLGGLCTFFLFGESGFAYIQIIAMFQNLVFFLFCFPMAKYYNNLLNRKAGLHEDITLASLFFNRNQLPVAGVVAGMLLYANNVPRPESFGTLFSLLIHVSAWMALFPVGYSIQFSEMQPYYRSLIDLLPVKFVVTPLAGYLIASQLFTDPEVLGAILIASSSPAGINAVVLARLYDFNVHVTSAAFFLTTALFLAAIYPALFLWLHMVY